MKKLKKSVLLLIVALCLFGCSSKTSEKQEEVTNNTQQENRQEGNNNQPPEGNFKDMGMMGTIGEIDLENNTITIKSNGFGMQGGNIPKGEQPSGDNQEPPEMPNGNSPSGEQPNKDNQEPPEIPEGQENFDTENIPEGMPKQGEESNTSYNVTEETVIKDASGNEISINELNVDDFVSYTLDGDNLLTITIMNMDGFQQQPKQ